LSRAWAFVYSVALGISLIASDMAVQPQALAQDQTAYQEQIAAFTAKLETARSTQADLNRRVICLNRRDAELVSQRNDLERRLGSLRTEENSLAPEVQRLEAEYHGHMSTFETERRNLEGFRMRLRDLEFRKAAQEHALRECKAKWYIPNVACDASYGLLELTGDIKNYDGDIAATARRERIAHESANFALERLEKSRRDLDSARNQANALAPQISRTEHEISAIKAALSNVRAEVQPSQILIGDFENSLTAAKNDVNLADARARTLRMLGSIGAKIDDAVIRSTAAIGRADATVGEEWMKSCRVS
jgi:chromosome segregation ATPase